jgi:hypothetical protein
VVVVIGQRQIAREINFDSVAVADRDGGHDVEELVEYGFIATAVCVLVGPIFVPFFIVPKMEWLFWGWFRCFLQYAFYQVIAAAVVYVIGNLMLGTLRLPPPGTLSTVQLMAWFPVLFITFLASIYALLKIPALTSQIFSGASGGSSVAILERLLA